MRINRFSGGRLENNLRKTPDGYVLIGPHDTKNRENDKKHTRSNQYLLIEESEAILIDAGIKGRFGDEIILLLEELQIDLEAIILTHFHYDHTGHAKRISEYFDSPIYSHEKDRRFIEKPELIASRYYKENKPNKRNNRLGKEIFIDSNDIRNLYPRDIHVDETFTEDEILKLKGKKIRVLSTPGHTPGSISLFSEDTKSLYVSDLDYCVNPPLPPNLGNVSALKESINKVLNLKAKFLGPGHMYNFYGREMVKDYLEKTLKIIEDTSKKVLEILNNAAEPLTLKGVVKKVYPLTPRFSYEPLISSCILCHLYYLKEKGDIKEFTKERWSWSVA